MQQPSACNNQAFNESYTQAAEKYIAEEKFTKLGLRYAENIANGRFLWRNRVGAEKIEVRGVVKSFDEKVVLRGVDLAVSSQLILADKA